MLTLLEHLIRSWAPDICFAEVTRSRRIRARRDRLAVSLRRQQAAGVVPDHAATLDDLREFQCLDPAIGR
jgi:hypothetical protein